MGKERKGSRRKKRGSRRRKERMGNILGWGEKQGKKKESAFREEVLGGGDPCTGPQRSSSRRPGGSRD